MKPYIEIFAALLTPTIALVTTYIAIQQYRNNRLKQRLDLFDRRMAIYKSVTAYISTITNIDPAQREDKAAREAFYGCAYESYFLFGEGIHTYLGIIRLKGLQADTAHVLLSGYSQQMGQEQMEAERQHIEECNAWLSNQFKELRERFEPYLKLETMR
jgi:hypothetical protein